jgi:hypothetical protein
MKLPTVSQQLQIRHQVFPKLILIVTQTTLAIIAVAAAIGIIGIMVVETFVIPLHHKQLKPEGARMFHVIAVGLLLHLMQAKDVASVVRTN